MKGNSCVFYPYMSSRISAAITIILLGLTTEQALAQNPGIITNLPGCDFVTGRLTAACVPIFVGHLITLVFSVVSAFFILNVMYAGYQIAMGSWTGEKSEGKDRVTWSVIGLVVTVCSYLILDLAISVITP